MRICQRGFIHVQIRTRDQLFNLQNRSSEIIEQQTYTKTPAQLTWSVQIVD